MLTIHTLKSAAKAGSYYQEDNYYAKDGEPPQGIWFGKGADLLNINGQAKLKEFVSVLEGKLSPNITMQLTKEVHRPGYDLTFSAPKSVSILAIVGKDNRVLEAHRIAVNETLKYIEEHYALTRVKKNNEVHIENAGNLLGVKFEHTDSRALDPNLHTHSVIMNATCRSDGEWRTLYFDQVYDNKMLLGVVYRGALAQELMKRGYEIVQTTSNGLFELKGFPQKLIDQFSKRRQQITEELQKMELTGAKAAQIANFNTREHKINVDPEHLELAWTIELQKCNSNISSLQEYSAAATERGQVTPPNPYYLANQSITKAAHDLGDWYGAFTLKDLKKKASGLSVSSYSPMLLDKVIAEQFKSGDLLALKNELITTQKTRDLEILNVLNLKHDQNKVLPIVTHIGADFLLRQQPKEFRQSLKFLFTNTDRQILISSTNSQNYIKILRPFVEISYTQGLNPIGLTQSFKQVKNFSTTLGIKRVQTINGFFLSCENRLEKIKQNPIKSQLHSKQIWILDFESQISSNQLNRLQNYAKEFGTRIIWTKNVNKPQAAINALTQHNIKQCKLDLQKSAANVFALCSHPINNPAIDLTNNPINKHDWQTNIANVVLHWATNKLAERNAVFPIKELQLELFSLGLTVSKEVLQSQLDLAIKHSINKVDGSLVTTQATVNLEQACLQKVLQGKNSMPSIMLQPKVEQSLTHGQALAINMILTTQDRFVAIQGVAGTGKTTMIRSLNKLCLDANFEIIGLTVPTAAKERLQEGSQNLASNNQLLKDGIKTLTVRKFLMESEKLLNTNPTLANLEYGGNRLFILDEASFVGTAEMFALLTKMEQLNVKLIVMGDYKQLSSVDAGRIFYLMLGSKMHSVVMTENVRFKSAKTLKVMQDIYQNKIPEALQRLSDSLIEIPDHNERLRSMATLYLDQSLEDQKNTILITPEHNDRKIVNTFIREGLKEQGHLTGASLTFNNLNSVNLTKAEQQKIYYFNEQHWICFIKKPFDLKVQLNEYYQVIYKNVEEQTLTLKQEKSGDTIIWSPEKQPSLVSVYNQEERNLMLGDQIRFTRNNHKTGIYNGQTATIIANTEGLLELKLQDDKIITLDLKELMNAHWDHAYAATTFAAQGATKTTTIALGAGSYSKQTLACDLKVGDVIMAKDDHAKDLLASKWVEILEILPESIKTQDRNGNNFILDLKKSPTDMYSKNQAVWLVCPNPLTRKKSSIPRLTSIGEFLVSVTRGDQVTLLIDHLESYQHTLETRLVGAGSALEYIDPNRNEVREKVTGMIQNITGRVKDEAIDLPAINEVAQKNINKVHSLHNSFVTVEQVTNALHANVLQYSSNWLGSPQKVTSLDARWGKKGSIVVKRSGNKIGFWHNFEKGVGGKNLLSLYMDLFNCDFKTAIKNITQELNLAPETKLFNQTVLKTMSTSKSQHTLDLKKIKYAQKIYNQGVSIENTLAQKYLREFRGITGKIPQDFKFCNKLKHPDLGLMRPALLAPIRNVDGNIQGVVRIFLNSDGNKLKETFINSQGQKLPTTVKANLGCMTNAAVIINQATTTGTVYIAEGIETALSIAQAKPLNTVMAALSVSNLKNVPLPIGTQKVVLCADYDGVNSSSNKSLIAAANFYLEKGLNVAIADPPKIIGMEKFDFNDALKHLGVNSIKESLQNASQHRSTFSKTVITTKQPLKINHKNKELTL